MNEAEILLETAQYGAFVAVVAALLYFITSRRERSGFRLYPDSPREWAHYWFRSLILAVTAGMLASPFAAIGSSLIALSALLLFGSSFAFWQSDRGFCIVGLTLSVVGFIWVFLFPQISIVCGV